MLSEQFISFSSVYPELVKQKFHSSSETDKFHFELPKILINLASIPDTFKVYSSFGSGNWSEIPWLAILDKDITVSTQNGYYIVYLYTSDLKKINLTLGIGWTQYEQEYGVREGKINIEYAVRELRKKLKSPLNDFSFNNLHLNAKKTLGKGYESGAICHKEYEIENMPSDNDLINDVRNLMGVYRELNGMVGKDILNLEINEEEADYEDFAKKVVEASEKVHNPDEAKEKIAELTKIIDHSPAPLKSKMARSVARNRKFAQLVKEAANFICQICGKQPFKMSNGGLYAEANHIQELASSRLDHPDNMMCVCAQCHRIITYGTEEELQKRIALKTERSN